MENSYVAALLREAQNPKARLPEIAAELARYGQVLKVDGQVIAPDVPEATQHTVEVSDGGS